MTFFVICFGLIALISSKCWVDDQIRRKRQARQFQEDFKATAMERYEQFEATALGMINALGPSLDERTKQMSQFYKDHPPPYARLPKILPIFVICVAGAAQGVGGVSAAVRGDVFALRVTDAAGVVRITNKLLVYRERPVCQCARMAYSGAPGRLC